MKIESRNQFIVYALLYAAHVDLDCTEEELAWIKRKYASPKFDYLYQEFLKHSEYKNLEVILTNKEQYFPGRNGTNELLSLILNLFTVDGQYSSLEQVSFTFLSRFLDQQDEQINPSGEELQTE